MTDIVERLRLQNDCLLGTGHDFSDVLLDAADEIERLRALLRESWEYVGYPTELWDRIREALGDHA